MSEPQWLSPSELRAWRGFVDMSNMVRRRVSQQLQRECGLSDADYEILVRLSEAPGGSMRAIELASATEWEKSRLSHQIRRMTERGLVTKGTCNNIRHSHVELSPQGRAAIEAAAPQHVAHVRTDFIDALTPEQINAFANIAETIINHLGPANLECDSAEQNCNTPDREFDPPNP